MQMQGRHGLSTPALRGRKEMKKEKENYIVASSFLAVLADSEVCSHLVRGDSAPQLSFECIECIPVSSTFRLCFVAVEYCPL